MVLALLLHVLALCITFLALLFIFYLIFCVTDNHLVPAVEVFINTFEIPETVAAVTLVAFGSATPELLLQSVAAIEKTNDISLSAILGSAMIAFGLIPPLCLLSTSHVELKLRAWPIIRETGFYILGLSVFLLAIEDGVVTTEEAVMMSSVYVVYVGTVVGIYMLSRESSSGSTSRIPGVGGMSGDDDDEEIGGGEATGLISGHQMVVLAGTGTGPITTTTPMIRAPSRRNVHNDDRHNDNTIPNPLRTTMMQPPLSPPRKEHTHTMTTHTHTHTAHAHITHPTLNPASGLMEDVEAISPLHETAMASLSALLSKYFSQRVSLFVAYMVPALESNAARERYNNREDRSNHSGGNSSRLLMDDDDDHDDSTTVGTGPGSPKTTTHPPGSLVSDSPQVQLFRAIWCLTTCIFYVGLLASLLVGLCHRIAHLLGIGGSTVGATLVALGSEIPDTISSISLAKKGYTDGAMSGAIGSQVINISIGVGLPALFVCLTSTNGLFFVEQTESLWILTALAFVVISVHITMTIPVFNLLRGLLVRRASITKSGAIVQVTTWTLAYVVFCVLNEWGKHNNETMADSSLIGDVR